MRPGAQGKRVGVHTSGLSILREQSATNICPCLHPPSPFRSEAGRRESGLPSFEKKFSGPLTKQMRDFRTFAKESGFFKVYQFRKPDGGFAEEPEYPPTVVDEAVLNAIAHRDYACTWPVGL